MQRPGKEENGMDHTMGILMIGAACLLVLLVAAMRSKTQIFLNFILRAVLGLLLIYFVNSFLDGRGREPVCQRCAGSAWRSASVRNRDMHMAAGVKKAAGEERIPWPEKSF